MGAKGQARGSASQSFAWGRDLLAMLVVLSSFRLRRVALAAGLPFYLQPQDSGLFILMTRLC